MKQRKLGKKIASWFLCMAMVLTTINLPTLTTTVKAAGTVNAPSKGTFWTQDELLALTGEKANEPYYATGKTFQKANWGSRTWYVIGAENDSLVMLADSQVGQSYFDGKTNMYGFSYIRKGLDGWHIDEFQDSYSKDNIFSPYELGYIANTRLPDMESYYNNIDNLYLPSGVKGSGYFQVGSMDQYSIPNLVWNSNNPNNGVEYFFWLRTPYETSKVLTVWPGRDWVDANYKDALAGSVVPAFHLRMDHCLFASSAPLASVNATKTVEVNGTMTFRMENPLAIKSSTAEYYGSKVTITKSNEETQPVYLCVQYNDGANDKIYTKLITSSQIVDLSDTIGDLTRAKIWLEMKAAEDNTVFATMATPGNGVKPGGEPTTKPSEDVKPGENTTPGDNTTTPAKPVTLKTQKVTTAKVTSYKASTLKKKAVKINLKAKASGKGKLTYKVKSTPKGMKKFITVSKKGVVTIKKKAKKGSYKITITAAAKGNFKKATKTITIKVK